MLHLRFSLTVGFALVVPGLLITRGADSPQFPPVPPASRAVSQAAEFPPVPPPSPGIAGGKAKVDTEAAKKAETTQALQLEAVKKTGKAPARAYATPVAVELPKAFVGKEAELQDLLDKYKADQVSAAEYHRKRAEIIARP